MIELVWDQQRAGTATIPAGRGLGVGEGTDFSPEELLAIAAAACLMRTCVRIAAEAGVDILSFTATARLDTNGTPPATRMHVRAQVVTANEVPEPRTLELWNEALSESPVARVLGDHLVAEVEITRLCERSSREP